MPSAATLRVQSADRSWETLGVERYGGVVPQGIKASANGWGADGLSCVLRRQPGAIFPDLATWTPCELEIGGIVVWDGRLKEAPEQDGDDFQVGVTGAGWQYHLDDDTTEKMWVHSRMPDWVDVRSKPTAPLAANVYCATAQVNVGDGGIVLQFPANTTIITGQKAAATFDAGPGCTIKRIVVAYTTSIPGAAGYQFVVYGHDNDDGANSGTADTAFSHTAGTLANGTYGGTFATPRRYATLQFNVTGAGGNPGNQDYQIRISSVIVFTSTAYESGNASVLKTSDLVKDVLPWAPLLSQDTSQIAQTSFSWPEFAPFDEKTAREIIEAALAAEQMQARLLAQRQLQLRALPSLPLFEIGAWSGAEFKDASANSGQEVYNKAKVRGVAPDGSKVTVTRTQIGTLVDRAPGGGFTRSKTLVMGAGLTTALGNQVGDSFLSVHRTTPLKGTVTITGHGGARGMLTGAGVPPALFLQNTRELLRLAHRIDPDTGGLGRDGRIANVDYDHDSETAVLAIDNQRDSFEALLSRLGTVMGA